MSGGTGLEQISSGIAGLDSILNGGFILGRMYLVRGSPGTGKSLLGQHFLAEGLANDETVVYIHGEETKQDIINNSRQLGIDVSGAHFLDLGPETEFFTENISYDLVDPSDIESEGFMDEIKDVINGYDPSRIFLDPITQLRHMESDYYQYRKRLLALMRFLRKRNTTVLTSRTRSDEDLDEQIESLTDGIIDLSYDRGSHRIEVPKHRGVGQHPGSHGMEIRSAGIEVFPQLLPTPERTFDPAVLSSDIPALDELLGGGIERGSVTFISGPTGVGKTTVGTHFPVAAAERGEQAVVYLFEENAEQYCYRSERLNLPMSDLRESEDIIVREIEPLVRSAEEVAQMIRSDVDRYDPSVVMLDGLAGYKVAIHGEEERLIDRLHALTRSLKNQGIAVLVMDEMSHLKGIPTATSTNTSYIADNVILLTYREQTGGLSHIIGVLKKRLGEFESQFRPFEIVDREGVRVGEPLEDVENVL